jgi:hypothetical protein
LISLLKAIQKIIRFTLIAGIARLPAPLRPILQSLIAVPIRREIERQGRDFTVPGPPVILTNDALVDSIRDGEAERLQRLTEKNDNRKRVRGRPAGKANKSSRPKQEEKKQKAVASRMKTRVSRITDGVFHLVLIYFFFS